MYTILISNHHNIIDLLGTDIYHLLIFDIYKNLKDQLSKDALIIQSDSNKLWIVLPEIDTEFYAKKN